MSEPWRIPRCAFLAPVDQHREHGQNLWFHEGIPFAKVEAGGLEGAVAGAAAADQIALTAHAVFEDPTAAIGAGTVKLSVTRSRATGNMTTYYKYCPPKEHYFDVVRSRAIRATQPAALNDPFEMAGQLSTEELERFAQEKPNEIPGLAEWVARDPHGARQRLQGEFARRNLDIIAQCGVICASSQWDTSPMWAHYSTNHAGFVLGFDSAVGVFRQMMKVTYADHPTRYEIDTTRDGVRRMTHTKSAVWSYENEYRAVGLLSECHDTGRLDASGHSVYVHYLREGCITEVTLGAQMIKEDAARLYESGKSHGLKVFQAVCDLESVKLVREELP